MPSHLSQNLRDLCFSLPPPPYSLPFSIQVLLIPPSKVITKFVPSSSFPLTARSLHVVSRKENHCLPASPHAPPGSLVRVRARAAPPLPISVYTAELWALIQSSCAPAPGGHLGGAWWGEAGVSSPPRGLTTRESLLRCSLIPRNCVSGRGLEPAQGQRQ